MKGHIRERKPGAGYTACWSDTDPGDGHRRQYSRHFAKKGEAQKFLNSVLTRVDNGTFVPDTAITVRQLLLDHWLPTQRSRELRSATLAQYQGVIENWILPRLGAMKVAALTPAAVVDFMAALRTEPGAKGKPLSARSVQLTTGILKAACAWAVAAELLGRNPIAGVRRPRSETPTMKFWTEEQAKAFLEATAHDRISFGWALLLTRGLRRGELCGLRWSVIDLEAGTLRVESTLITVEGRPVASRPKTKKGERPIDLDADLISLLRTHKARQAAEKLAAGTAYEDGGFLVADELGHPYHPDSVSGWFEAAVERAGLPRIRLHDTRHTAASLLLAAGEPVKVVSEMLGHANVSVTLSTYAHVMPGMAKEAGARLSARLLG